MSRRDERRHILTVSVEEYFHGEALSRVVREKHWERFEPRLEPTIERSLLELERFGRKATFFVLGALAERHPAVVERITGAGHEVAASGFWPRHVRGMDRKAFGVEAARARRAVEAATGMAVHGYRAPRWIGREDLWILDVLAQLGFSYDASIQPADGGFGRRFRSACRHPSGLWELPVTVEGDDLRLRNPARALRKARRWRARESAPLVLSFRSWELDPDQPRVTAASRSGRLRQYHNLHRTGELLEPFLRDLDLVPARQLLGLAEEPAKEQAAPGNVEHEPIVTVDPSPVSVVVPMHNEEQNVPYLLRTLGSVQERLRGRYDLELVLVDDGSTDRTWDMLQAACGGREDAKLLRHTENLGVARAILTGIRGASSEIVVSVDCDCSYDPHEIENLVPLLDGADLVTASPYHPDGRVLHVPAWRLFLSKSLSRLYRRALRSDLHTFTSCFRAYRRAAVKDLQLESGGFLGVAEMLVRVIRRGGRVVEYPTQLESRLLGFSKMRTLRTIRDHLRMLWKLRKKGAGLL